jgi:hypothetical protein
MRSHYVAIGVLLIAGTAMAQQVAAQSCKTSPNIVGACFAVHGRLFVANGTPSVRILRIGTDRILGVLDRQFQAEGEEVVPELVNRLLMPDPFFTDVYGDYLVCPFEKQEFGRMQMVCIESADHLIARPRDVNKTRPSP